MSGAVEGVDFIESSARRVAFRTRTVMTNKHLADFAAGQPVEGADDAPRVTTPPARSYEDGVEDAARIVSQKTQAISTKLGRGKVLDEVTLGIIAILTDAAADIRLLSQGEKA